LTENKKIAILGAGESGTGAAILASKVGYKVFVSDFGVIKESYKKEIKDCGAVWEEGKHNEVEILSATEIIKSPGIPDTAPIIQKAIEKEIPVISEIEFAGRYANGKKICITGSNGKTTTAKLLFHIFKNDNKTVSLAGNVGKSFARQVAEKEFDYYILELSSFQLDNMYDFKADTAILLNITPDHLDRYDYKIENYARSKLRIIQNQTEEDNFIYCADDPETIKILEEYNPKAQIHTYSVKEKANHTAYLENNKMTIKTKKHTFTEEVENLALPGIHNVANSMAAGISSKLAGIRSEALRDSFASYKGVEHRLEHVLNVWGVKYINDSKATNVNAVWYALQSMKENVVLLLGGIDKGNDYGMIKDLVRRKVNAIICIGEDNSPIHAAFAEMVPLYETDTMDTAVKLADEITEKGDTVLLAPACSSFDRYKNFEERGRVFKKAVHDLAK